MATRRPHVSGQGHAYPTGSLAATSLPAEINETQSNMEAVERTLKALITAVGNVHSRNITRHKY